MRSKQLLSNDVSPDKDDWHRRRLAQGCLYSTASIMLSVYASSFGRRVVPATISVESERIAPGHIIQRSPFVRFEISDLGESQLQSVMEKLSGFGTEYHFIASEATLVCSKLCLLAPLALTTTAAGRTIGEILSDPQWELRLRSYLLFATVALQRSRASRGSNQT